MHNLTLIRVFFFVGCICSMLNAQEEKALGGTLWTVSEGKLNPIGKNIDSLATRYWTYLNQKLPATVLRRYVTQLRLFTDGADEELASMASLDDLNSTWEMAIDTLDFNLKRSDSIHIREYMHTMIHEFGHLVTLNREQVNYTEDSIQDWNKGYLTSEGYARKNSYLNSFVTRFWEGRLLDKWDKINESKTERQKLRRLYALYRKYEDDFLTDYAAESPEEDIAESWTFFILCDAPSSQLNKHQKILFFYDYPELVDYRNQIRNAIRPIPKNYLALYTNRLDESDFDD